MSSNLSAWEAKMNKLAATYAASGTDIVTASARAYTNAIRSEINSVTSGGKLRGVGKRGSRVGVRYTIQASTERPSAVVQATGPLQLIERDTKAHNIPKTEGSRRLRTQAGRLSKKREATGRNTSRSARRVLKIGERYVTGPVRHPGTRGKHPFERGVIRSERKAITDSIAQLHNAISGILK